MGSFRSTIELHPRSGGIITALAVVARFGRKEAAAHQGAGQVSILRLCGQACRWPKAADCIFNAEFRNAGPVDRRGAIEHGLLHIRGLVATTTVGDFAG